jgi:hypothetical protein
MSAIIDGTNGITTPGVVNTAGETIATTLSVTGVTTLTGGLNAALPVLSGGTGVTTKTGTGAVVLGTSPSISGAVMTTMASSVITSGTSVASTSGTSIDFTSIPSWVKRITVMFSGVSTNGTSYAPLVQIGSGSVTTSGYVSGAQYFYSTNITGIITSTSGFVAYGDSPADLRTGNMTILLLGGTTYISSHIINSSAANQSSFGSGNINLSGALDRIRITTVNGTDTFDAGAINILYE